MLRYESFYIHVTTICNITQELQELKAFNCRLCWLTRNRVSTAVSNNFLLHSSLYTEILILEMIIHSIFGSFLILKGNKKLQKVFLFSVDTSLDLLFVNCSGNQRYSRVLRNWISLTRNGNHLFSGQKFISGYKLITDSFYLTKECIVVEWYDLPMRLSAKTGTGLLYYATTHVSSISHAQIIIYVYTRCPEKKLTVANYPVKKTLLIV